MCLPAGSVVKFAFVLVTLPKLVQNFHSLLLTVLPSAAKKPQLLLVVQHQDINNSNNLRKLSRIHPHTGLPRMHFYVSIFFTSAFVYFPVAFFL